MSIRICVHPGAPSILRSCRRSAAGWFLVLSAPALLVAALAGDGDAILALIVVDGVAYLAHLWAQTAP